MYLANTMEVGSWSRDLEGVVWWWGKIVYFGFPTIASFGKMPCWDGILPRKGSRWLDHLIHAIEVSGEVAQVLIDSGKERKAYSKIKQIEILSWNE